MRNVLGALLLLATLLAGPAAAEPRVALIIGNGDYRSIPRLDNAPGDARAMDKALRADGFETVLKLNATRRETYAAITAFAARLDAGAVGLFYYAGHGIQADGRNYLVPVDAQIASEDDLRAEAVDVGVLLHELALAHNPVNIVILDSCRDNPLPRTRSMARGLGRMDSPQSTFIAYAAAPGQTARDGPAGGSGLFTGELVKQLAVPGLKLEDVFKQVTRAVVASTNGTQVPWTESSIQADFFFLPPVATPPVAAEKPPQRGVFRDCPDCPEMVMLPPGQFQQGTPPAETSREGLAKSAANMEQPRHSVTVSNGFALGRYHVTRGEYARFVAATGRANAADCTVGGGGRWTQGGSWREPGFPQTDRDPVVCVTWEDATAYAAWLAQLTGKPYRLPSEAEWEYAARAGTVTARWWGESIGRNQANCSGCGGAWDGRRTSPVGSFQANPFGLSDMLGDVWQWVEDCWTESYANAPGDAAIALVASGDCGRRVVRGGSWDSTPSNLRAGHRGQAKIRERDNKLGFRVARSQ